ncbi:hypothetical protein V6N13_126941 [Hibiscus sabdariffa]
MKLPVHHACSARGTEGLSSTPEEASSGRMRQSNNSGCPSNNGPDDLDTDGVEENVVVTNSEDAVVADEVGLNMNVENAGGLRNEPTDEANVTDEPSIDNDFSVETGEEGAILDLSEGAIPDLSTEEYTTERDVESPHVSNEVHIPDLPVVQGEEQDDQLDGQSVVQTSTESIGGIGSEVCSMRESLNTNTHTMKKL